MAGSLTQDNPRKTMPTASGHGAKRERKEELAIAALLAAGSIPEAAKAAGISPTTLDAWLRDAAFVAAYARARRQVLEGVVNRLQQAATKAIAALERNLDCGTPSVEVRAAESLLTHTFRGAEVVEIARRLEELEAALRPGGPEPW